MRTSLRSRPPQRWFAGVRARSTAAAVVVVAVALLIAAVTLVIVLQRSVRDTAIATATARAQDVAAELVVTGTVTQELNLQPGPGEASVVQVMDRGRVVAASAAIEAKPALTDVTPAAGRARAVGVGPLARGVDDSDDAQTPYAVVALGVAGVSGVDTVVVAQSAGPGRETVAEVATMLAVGCPLLVLLVGAVTYLLVGRALRPVEDIRRQTSGISGADLTARVPVPATGDEVARLAETMNEMLGRLNASQRVQRQFISDASHELRSPLATLRAAVDVASLHPQDTDWGLAAQDIRAETVRMQHLVDDLLTLAEADENGVRLHREEVDLDDVVGDAVNRLRQEHRRDVVAHLAPVRTIGDRNQLARVVRNLADNAARHARSRVAVTVRTGPDGSAVVEIADDGPGVPAAERGRVFDRFVRLDAGRDRSSGGSGLGLAIVREIVAAHGGVVTVDDDPALGGARFQVVLPSA